MLRRIAQALTLSIFLLMYVIMEFLIFKELGLRSGLLASLYFTVFSIAMLTGFMYRPPVAEIGDEIEEEANCPS